MDEKALETKTIMVLDDDEKFVSLISDYLEQSGYSVISEANSEWALMVLRERKIDLLITDVLLPGISGFELINEIRNSKLVEKNKNIPIIVVSGVFHKINHYSKELESKGVIEYLDKPVDSSKILSCAQKAIGQSIKQNRTVTIMRDKIDKDENLDIDSSIQAYEGSIISEGNLKDKSFLDLLSQIYRVNANGSITLIRGKVKKQIFIRKGQPIYVKSNLLKECLGQMLLKEKLISEDECKKSVQRMKKNKLKQGTVLVQMGCLSPHNLKFLLEKQMSAKIHDIFSWKEGSFVFKTSSKFPKTTITVTTPTPRILYLGMKKFCDNQELENLSSAYMKKNYWIKPQNEGRLKAMDLSRKERSWISDLAQNKVPENVFNSLEKDSKYSFLALLVSLVKSNLIEERKAAETMTISRSLNFEDSEIYPPIPGSNLPGDQLRNILIDTLELVNKKDFFDRLGVKAEFSRKDIDHAFRKLAGKYHPDRFLRYSDEIKNLSQEIFEKISDAYDTLSDRQKREEYLRQTNPAYAMKDKTKLDHILNAERLYKQALSKLEMNRYENAITLLKNAIDIYPYQAEFYATYGWCLFRSSPNSQVSIAKSRELFEKAQQINPKSSKNYLFLGYMEKYLGNRFNAKKHFEKALECDPSCKDSQSELRLIKVREEKNKTAKKKTLLSFFSFGK